MCIAIACQLSCVVINFEINLTFLIKPFLLHNQKVTTYLQNEKSFPGEIKNILRHFRKAFIEANKTIFFGR